LLVATPPNVSIWFLLAVYAIDSLKALTSATLLRRLNPDGPRLENMQQLVQFFVVAVLGTPMFYAFAGALTRLSLGDSYWAAWQSWFFGSALASEGLFAFALESGFLGVLLFGWNRVSPKVHFFSTVMLTAATSHPPLKVSNSRVRQLVKRQGQPTLAISNQSPSN
jgi:integral membrane sensor domain MASE1